MDKKRVPGGWQITTPYKWPMMTAFLWGFIAAGILMDYIFWAI